jgi:hypothetical protein
VICSKCNAPVKEGEKFCPGCGNDLSVDPPIQGEANNQVVNNEINDHSVEQPAVNNEQSVGTSANSVPVQDKVNIWLVILSWFIPLAGLIIFFVQKKSSPKTAKASGICALISALLSIIVTIACFALVFGTFNVVHKNAKEDMDTMIEDVLDKADQIMEDAEDQMDELEDEVNSGDTSSTTTPSDSTTTVTVSNDWKQYQIAINNKVYALPMSYSDFKTATGFALKDTYINMVLPNNHYAPVNLYKNDKLALYIELFNNSGLESKYVESKVTRVSQTKYQISQGADAIVFPGGLKVGDSVTDAQIVTLFGQPNDLKDNGSSKQYTYLSDTTWTTTNNFKIKLVNGIIDEIQLDNRK